MELYGDAYPVKDNGMKEELNKILNQANRRDNVVKVKQALQRLPGQVKALREKRAAKRENK